MPIVDSQIHLWENARMSPQHRQIPTYNVDDALKEMAEAAVDAAVIHPPSTLGEAVNTLAVEAVRHHPDKFCILGHFEPDVDRLRLSVAQRVAHRFLRHVVQRGGERGGNGSRDGLGGEMYGDVAALFRLARQEAQRQLEAQAHPASDRPRRAARPPRIASTRCHTRRKSAPTRCSHGCIWGMPRRAAHRSVSRSDWCRSSRYDISRISW